METVRVIVVTDASFANARDLRSQLGYLVLMVDGQDNANIIHYGSRRCKRVTRSVMASEVHALSMGCDYGIIIPHMIEETSGSHYPI